jgi:hypothetical protein
MMILRTEREDKAEDTENQWQINEPRRWPI